MKTEKEIFIVDDDPYWTEMLTKMLNDLGYDNVIAFDNGHDCIRNLYRSPYIIFLDQIMEDLDGIEVLMLIKDSHPETKVVFSTSIEDMNLALCALNLGSVDFLLKERANEREVGLIINNMEESLV